RGRRGSRPASTRTSCTTRSRRPRWWPLPCGPRAIWRRRCRRPRGPTSRRACSPSSAAPSPPDSVPPDPPGGAGGHGPGRPRLPRGARRASGELGEGAFGLLEPGAPGGEGLLGLLDVLIAAGVPGLGEALLQLLDGGAQLAHGRLGPRAGLRVGPPPLVLLGGADGLLDLAEPAFEAVALVAGHHARGLPALLHDAQRLPGLAHVPDGQQPLRLGEDLLLLR